MGGEGVHVVVEKLVVTRGDLARGGPPGKLQVRTAKVLLLVDKEDILLKALVWARMWERVRVRVRAGARAMIWVRTLVGTWERMWTLERVCAGCGRGQQCGR